MSDDDESGHGSDDELKPEESLVHGRARRSTAGNRLSILLQAYADEDIQNDLLKDEEEDQVDYEASDDGGDIDLESSDESDDQGPPKEGEEEKLEGEKELQKQERVEARKNKKRKAQDLLRIPQPKKKRPSLATDTSNTTAAEPSSSAPRQRKKSERISWLPAAEDAPTRQSLRNATVLNKEQTEVRLKEAQKRSVKAHDVLRMAAEKRAANAGPVLTQADRIARALKTEKENSKSLNRWVQVEEERRAVARKRLEALRNRQIEGPVIRYWGGSVIWEGDKIKVNRVHQPRVEVVEENEQRSDVQKDPVQPDAEPQKNHPVKQESDQAQVDHPIPMINNDAQTETTKSDSAIKADTVPVDTATEPPKGPNPQSVPFLDGIHFWASQSPAETTGKDTECAGQDSQSLPSNPPESTPVVQKPSVAEQQYVPNTFPSATPYIFTGYPDPLPAPSTADEDKTDSNPAVTTPTATPIPPPPPPAPLLREQALRTLLTLNAFPELENIPPPPPTTSRSKQPAPSVALISSILLPGSHPTLSAAEQKYLTARSLKKKGDNFLPDRPAKAACCITTKEARFRDPRTGLGYRDLAAFKSLQRALAGGCAWSEREGVWVGIVGEGRMGRVAKGVPDGFWSGEVPKPPPKKVEAVKIEDDGVKQGQAQAQAQTCSSQVSQPGLPAQARSQTQTQPQFQPQHQHQPQPRPQMLQPQPQAQVRPQVTSQIQVQGQSQAQAQPQTPS